MTAEWARKVGTTRVAARKAATGKAAAGKTAARAALLMGSLAAGLACADADSRSEREDAGRLRGFVLEEPFAAPDFTLPDTEGSDFEFRAETAGFLTFLFFGYANCPDICPVHLANLAAVLDDLPYEARRRVKVVFVTTDPARDQPEVVRRWLDRFDRTFVGLGGDLDVINEIQATYRLPPAGGHDPEGGDYLVGHAAQMLAVSPDGAVRVAYPAGTRQADLAHDLRLLLEATTVP